jgi:hypothetical protein
VLFGLDSADLLLLISLHSVLLPNKSLNLLKQLLEVVLIALMEMKIVFKIVKPLTKSHPFLLFIGRHAKVENFAGTLFDPSAFRVITFGLKVWTYPSLLTLPLARLSGGESSTSAEERCRDSLTLTANASFSATFSL